jgi:outer membrane protein assembly factor BamB
MFHVKHGVLKLTAGLLLLVTATGCVGAAGSQGWMAPVETGSLLLVSSDKGQIDAVDPESGEIRWVFGDSDASNWQFPARAAGHGTGATLEAGIDADDTNATVTNTDAIEEGQSVAIGDEIARVLDIQGGILTLIRDAGVAEAHPANTPVIALRDEAPEGFSGIYAGPITVDGIIYVADYSGFVYALQERSPGIAGRVLWYRELEGELIGDIAVDEASGNLFVPSSIGKLYVLKISDGTDAFGAFEAGDRIWGGPLIEDGNVYFGAGNGHLYTIDAATGSEVRAPFAAGGDILVTPARADSRLLFGSFDDKLYAIDYATGEEVWTFTAANWIWSEVLVVEDRVYVADFDGHVYAVSLEDGSPLWQQPFDTGTSVRAAPVLSNGVLVVATTDGEIWGINPETGGPAWNPIALDAPIHGNLAVIDGDVLVSASDCTVTEADPNRRVSFFRIHAGAGSSEPVLGNEAC